MLHKTRKWTRSPKGVPAVKGATQAERAQLIRYFMAHDNKVQFAVKIPATQATQENISRFVNISPCIFAFCEICSPHLIEGRGEMTIIRESLHELSDWRTLVEIVVIPSALFGLICAITAFTATWGG